MTEGYEPVTGFDTLPVAADSMPTGSGEHARAVSTQRCEICGQRISVRSYLVNSKTACVKCASAGPVATAPVRQVNYARGLLFGLTAALAGLAVYALFTIVTHLYLGYIALAVGWMVGKAIVSGSRGERGVRYQVAAVLLTYGAISLAAVPILIAQVLQENPANVAWSSIVGKLMLWGLASPLLQMQRGITGIIGLVILFVGLRIASRITAASPHGPIAHV